MEPRGNARPAKAIVVVNENSYSDALAAAPLASAVHGALVLSRSTWRRGDPFPSCTEGDLLEPVDTAYVIGGTAVLDPTIEASLRYQGISTITRIGGGDRYQTAARIAEAIDSLRPASAPQRVFLASGTGFADALTAGAPAGDVFGSVLLTRGAVVPSATSAYLAARPGATVYAVGGQAAAAVELPSVDELVGQDRYETAVLVAERFFPSPTSAVFASGALFPDAASASAYGGHVGAPVLLVRPDAVPSTVTEWARGHRAVQGSVLPGGRAAVSERAFLTLERGLTPTS